MRRTVSAAAAAAAARAMGPHLAILARMAASSRSSASFFGFGCGNRGTPSPPRSAVRGAASCTHARERTNRATPSLARGTASPLSVSLASCSTLSRQAKTAREGGDAGHSVCTLAAAEGPRLGAARRTKRRHGVLSEAPLHGSPLGLDDGPRGLQRRYGSGWRGMRQKRVCSIDCGARARSVDGGASWQRRRDSRCLLLHVVRGAASAAAGCARFLPRGSAWVAVAAGDGGLGAAGAAAGGSSSCEAVATLASPRFAALTLKPLPNLHAGERI